MTQLPLAEAIATSDIRAVEHNAQPADLPLVVDVDGTLVRGDLLVESAIRLFGEQPFDALQVPRWLLAGKSRLKTEIASRVELDIDTLPLDPDVLALMREAKAQGRAVYLASASDRRYVEQLAERLGFVDGVFATDTHSGNLSGRRKCAALIHAFGEGGFDYVGDAKVDLPVWRAARHAYVVRTGLLDPASGIANAQEIADRRPPLKGILKGLRLHQWAKNFLLFVPLALGGAYNDIHAVMSCVASFFALGILASSTYILNDILDVSNDRQHPTKRRRPLASGAVPVTVAAGISVCGLVAGLAIGAVVGLPVLLALLCYLVGTLAYSLRLKRVPIVDATLLGGLYTWRIVIGIFASNVALSPWLMVFSFAFFLSLSLAKRHTEITKMIEAGKTSLVGRGYRLSDGPFVMAMGVAAAVSSILIFVLYLIEGAFRAAFFSAPEVLWAVPVILLMWLCRVWLLCGRGELHDDPVEFAVKDRKSLILGACAAVAVILALVG